MSISKTATDPHQFDLFVPYIADLPLRDQRETMERPFFSLAKRKRLKPIEYVSPDRSVFVNVFPNQEFGMATIWDADILIWAASCLYDQKRKGVNDLSRTIHFHPYDLLKTIHRATGGRQYMLLREGLARLQATTVVTNIRAQKGKKHRQFSWIESWTDHIDNETNQSRGMSVTLAEWFYEGVLMEGGVLAIDPVYFSITGGRERWLYRVARKHAGGAGKEGFAISLRTLFEKSGAEGGFRRFKFETLKIVSENAIPQYDLSLELGSGRDAQNPLIRMIRRDEHAMPASRSNAPKHASPLPKASGASTPSTYRAARPRGKNTPTPSASQSLILPYLNQLSEQTITMVRKDFPGWDIYALKAEFDDWLERDASRHPDDYNKAFYGFVRRYHKRAQ